MADNPRLSSLTMVGFEANVGMDSGNADKVSFDDIYNGLRRGTLFQDLDSKLPGQFDFSILTVAEAVEGARVIGALNDAAAALEGRERRKVGVEHSGLALLVALVLEAIQQGSWLAPR